MRLCACVPFWGRVSMHRRKPACEGTCTACPRRRTPLHYAAEKGKYDVVRLLAANRADVNARNSDGSVEYSRRRCTFSFVTLWRVRSDLFIVVTSPLKITTSDRLSSTHVTQLL